MEEIELINLLAEKVNKIGGKTYFVGGYVRDTIQGIESKDYDIEVHGVHPKDLEAILDSIGKRKIIGENFGIYTLKGYDIDIALPRKEHLRGLGHQDFDVIVDPFIGTKEAAKRRDFTINSLMKDVLTGEIIDHFGGLNDLKNKIIRHVNDESFTEDALRVLRGCGFAARFNFKIANETINLCKTIDLSNLSKERIYKEIEKVFLKSSVPSRFFNYLRQMNQLDFWFKELKDLIDVPQDKKYHPEGDVWNHTMNVIDEGSKLLNKVKSENHVYFMYSCLCHDIGKSVTTTINEDGKIHAIGHEIKGLDLVKKFIKRITSDKKLINYVLNMVELHMRPNRIACDNSSFKASNNLFDLAVSKEDVILLAMADALGSGNTNPWGNYDMLMDRLDHYNELMKKPFVTAEDLISAGAKPGIELGDALKFAHKLQLSEVSYHDALMQTIKEYHIKKR